MDKHRMCECCKTNFLLKDMKGDLCIVCYDFIQTRQNDKISDLEAKLAESEKDRLMWQEMYKSADRQNKNICETDIYPLQEENENYQKLINDICNKHRVVNLKELDEMYQATKESLYASREYLEELKSEKWGLEKALELAVEELDDAKDMLRDCGKNEWASLLNTSADYFKAKAKGEK